MQLYLNKYAKKKMLLLSFNQSLHCRVIKIFQVFCNFSSASDNILVDKDLLKFLISLLGNLLRIESNDTYHFKKSVHIINLYPKNIITHT